MKKFSFFFANFTKQSNFGQKAGGVVRFLQKISICMPSNRTNWTTIYSLIESDKTSKKIGCVWLHLRDKNLVGTGGLLTLVKKFFRIELKTLTKQQLFGIIFWLNYFSTLERWSRGLRHTLGKRA